MCKKEIKRLIKENENFIWLRLSIYLILMSNFYFYTNPANSTKIKNSQKNQNMSSTQDNFQTMS